MNDLLDFTVECPPAWDRTGKRGKKPLLVGKLRLRFLAMVEVGGRPQDAARLCGISMNAVATALREDEQFARAIKQCEMRGKGYFLARIYRGAQSDWRAAAWWLERRYRTQFGRQFADKDYESKPVHIDLEFGDGKKVTAKLPSGVELIEREIGPESPDKKSVRTVSWPSRGKLKNFKRKAPVPE